MANIFIGGKIGSDYENMWKKLGFDLIRHDVLQESLRSNYENIIASQPNRPIAMAYFDGTVDGIVSEWKMEFWKKHQRWIWFH